MIVFGEKIQAGHHSYKFIKAGNGWIFGHIDNVIHKLNPKNCKLPAYKYANLVVSLDLVGVKIDGKHYFAVEHAINRAKQKNMIAEFGDFPHFVQNVIENGEVVYKQGRRRLLEQLNHKRKAKFIICKTANVVLVMNGNTVVTVYEYEGSIFYKKDKNPFKFKSISRPSELVRKNIA